MEIQRSKAVLVSLNVSVWAANKLDREVSEEVANQKKLKSNRLGRYWKSLLPENEYMKAIHGVVAKARKFHYANTFAWAQEGARLLPTTNYFEYMEFMRDAKSDFERAVATFLKKYGELREIAKDALNSIYKESDYPSVEQLRRKFSFETLVMPVPQAAMFTAEIEPEETQRVREEIERTVQEAFRAANRDLWERLYSTINRMQERLMDPKGARESSLASLRDMLQLLGRLNVTGDEKLEQMRKQAEERLNAMSLKDFKSNEARRQAAIEETNRVMSAMAAFMGGNPDEG